MKRLIQKKLKKTKENLYYILSALMIGLIVGGIDTLFGRVLIAITDFRGRYIQILIWFLPIAGLFICWMYHRFNEMSLKGMTLVLETAQGKRADIPQCHLDKDCFIVRNSYTADKHFVYLLYFYLITLLT